MIAGLLALYALAIVALGWIVAIAVSLVPVIGRKHRHRDWEVLNAPADRERRG